MDINENSMVPIYVQIADAIEDDILSGKHSKKENHVIHNWFWQRNCMLIRQQLQRE